MPHDMFGNPIEELRSLTRESLNELMNKFETSEHDDTTLIQLENEAWHYRNITSYAEVFEHDGRYGVYHDLFDVESIPPLYDELRLLDIVGTTMIYIARSGNKYGIVKADGLGTEMYPFVCDAIEPYAEIIDLCSFRRDGKVGLLTLNGNERYTELLAPIYDSLDAHPGTPYIELRKDGKVGLHGAALALPPIYEEIRIPQYLGWIQVNLHGQWGYINHKGQFTEDINQAFLYHSSIFL